MKIWKDITEIDYSELLPNPALRCSTEITLLQIPKVFHSIELIGKFVFVFFNSQPNLTSPPPQNTRNFYRSYLALWPSNLEAFNLSMDFVC